MRKVALVAAVCGIVPVLTGSPANASVPPTMVWVDNRCAVQEFTRLELWYGAYHDAMYANPKVDPGSCEFGVVDWSNGPTWWPTNGGQQTAAPGVYDGPGHKDQAYVHDLTTDTWAFGPEN